MTDIIQLDQFRAKPATAETRERAHGLLLTPSMDITTQLTHANLLRDEWRETHTHLNNALPRCESPEQLERWMTGLVMETMLEQHIISPDTFLCGQYISSLLTAHTQRSPASWYTFEAAANGNYKEAGDTAFLILAAHPAFADRHNRPIKAQDYRDLGAHYYAVYHEMNPRSHEIGLHMAIHFDQMVEVAQTSLTRFKR